MPFSLACAAALVIGLAAGFSLDIALAGWPVLVTLGALVAAWRAGAQGLTAVARGLSALALVAAGVALGTQAVTEAEYPPLARWLDERIPAGAAARLDEPVWVEGRVVRDASPSEAGAQLVMDVGRISRGGAWEWTRGGVSITVTGSRTGPALDAWRAGRHLRLPVLLRRPTRYLNHGVVDAARAMARRGTALVGTVKSADLVEVVEKGAWWDEGAAAVRAAVRSTMRRRVGPWDDTSAAVGTAILIGDRAQLDPAVQLRLQEAGTFHVIAISGGNIALLAGAVLALLWLVGMRSGGAAALTVGVLLAHAWVIGGGASVLRATLMASVYLGLRVVDQRTAPVHAVAWSATLMLLINPLDLQNAGFWLTFGASGALLALAARWSPAGRVRWWHAPFGIVAGSLAVELVLMPVSALVFQRVTLAGMALNLAAVPAMGVVQATASVCVAADALGLDRLARLSAAGTHLAARVLLESSHLVDLAPWATWRVPSPGVVLMGAYYLVLIAWWQRSAREHGARVRVLAVMVAVLWCWIATAPPTKARARGDGRLHVTTWDVGQGDATLVTFPNGRTALVDAGGISPTGSFDVGDRVLGPALRFRGLSRVDYLVVSHGDADHIGGAASIARDFRPSEVWVGVPVAGHPLEAALAESAAGSGAAWRWLQRGDRLAIGGVEVRVHHPPLPDWERQRVRNDDSVVLELRHGEVAVLLTGDVSREVEQALSPGLDLPPTVVMKMPHHGSLTSSGPALLSRARPAVALVSAGRGNMFGHPAPAVVARYVAHGAEVFRTDLDGQIDLVTDGRALEVSTFTGRRWRRP